MSLEPLIPQKKYTLGSFTQLLKNLLPFGILWKNLNETFDKLLESFAVEMNRHDQRVIDLQTELIPGLSTEDELLTDWEDICLLPDEVPAPGTSEAERQNIVHTKYTTELPGPNEDFWVSYAAGLNITITSISARDYFRVGVSRVGERLGGELNIAYTWVVNYTGGTTAERAAMKAYFTRLRPAHTIVEFNPEIP